MQKTLNGDAEVHAWKNVLPEVGESELSDEPVDENNHHPLLNEEVSEPTEAGR